MPPTQHHNLFADDFSTNPWWWRDMPPAPTGLKDVPDQTDVVVIGGGYAGLSCALELAQAGGAVIVIDADDIGFGRTVNLKLRALLRHSGGDTARRY